jgi:hypothetical protein
LLGLRVIRLRWRRVRNSHYRSNGSDIGDRRRSLVNSLRIAAIVWSPAGPPMSIVAVKMMGPGAIPAIGVPMGVVISIWICLGAQRVQGQDKAHHQDNTQPSSQVHWFPSG